MARSFLQAVSTEEVAPPLRVVQIEGLVLVFSLTTDCCSLVWFSDFFGDLTL